MQPTERRRTVRGAALPAVRISAWAVALAACLIAFRGAAAKPPASGGRAAAQREDPSYAPTTTWLPRPKKLPTAEAATEAEMRPYREEIPGTDVTFEMVPIPAGRFVMGSREEEPGRKDDEGPRFEVALDAFWMGKYEVTWDEYELWAMGIEKQLRALRRAEADARDRAADAITMPTKPYADMTFGMGKRHFPAICMTQLAAKMYCKWLSAKTGRYYRLPTEAEWEYACRAGTTTAYSFGDDPARLPDYAWFFDNADDRYHRVGQKKPNRWGLYDMHGNVAEWVLDQYTPDGYAVPKAQPVRNPLVVPTRLFPRVVRGGGWIDDPQDLRSAARRGSSADWKAQDPQVPQSIWYHTDAAFVGFRVVRPFRLPLPAEAARYDLDETQRTEMSDYSQAKGLDR